MDRNVLGNLQHGAVPLDETNLVRLHIGILEDADAGHFFDSGQFHILFLIFIRIEAPFIFHDPDGGFDELQGVGRGGDDGVAVGIDHKLTVDGPIEFSVLTQFHTHGMNDTIGTVLTIGDADHLAVPEGQVVAVRIDGRDAADGLAVIELGNDLLKGYKILIDTIDQLLKGGQFLVGLVQFRLYHARARREESQYYRHHSQEASSHK